MKSKRMSAGHCVQFRRRFGNDLFDCFESRGIRRRQKRSKTRLRQRKSHTAHSGGAVIQDVDPLIPVNMRIYEAGGDNESRKINALNA